MGLIKSANSPCSLVPFSMADIERQAKRMLLRAQQQAEQLLAAAQAEAQQLKQQGTEQGLAEGRRQGLAQGLDEGRETGRQQALAEHGRQLQQVLQALSQATGALDSGRADLEAAALKQVVQLALAIARRVTKRQAMIDPEVLAANLHEVMKLAVKAADVRIAIHPSQRKTLDEALVGLRMQWPALTHVHLIDDGSLHPGGCRVFTEGGQIDAALDAQLDRLATELLPAL